MKTNLKIDAVAQGMNFQNKKKKKYVTLSKRHAMQMVHGKIKIIKFIE